MTTPADRDLVQPGTALLVRLLAFRGLPPEVIASSSGVPVTLVPSVVAGEIGGPVDEREINHLDAIVSAVIRAVAEAEGAPPSVPDDEETARWLAEQSGHPRYTMVEDGWRTLTTSTGDVELAYHAAIARLGSDRSATAEHLRSARDVLRRVAEAAERRS